MGTSISKKGLRGYTPLVLGLDIIARPFLSSRPHIFIACMPKSGSTFLAHALAAHDGLRRVRLTPAWGAREQELCELRLSRYNHVAYVSQHHVKYSDWTQELIRRYHLTPVVLVRDLFDIVVSLRDHVRREGRVTPIASFTERHVRLPDDELEATIVDLAIPWFINFYVGWREAPGALLIRYEDVVADPGSLMGEIFVRAGVEASPQSIGNAIKRIEGKENRMNKGERGRGKTLRPETRERIIRYLAHYPELHDDSYIAAMLGSAPAPLRTSAASVSR